MYDLDYGRYSVKKSILVWDFIKTCVRMYVLLTFATYSIYLDGIFSKDRIIDALSNYSVKGSHASDIVLCGSITLITIYT